MRSVPSGVGILTAGIILAIMIVPFVASITRDIFDQIPPVLRESAYGIGCTTWEVVRHVLLPQAGVSIIGAVMLGLGRALGETMAVTFVIGNANRLSALALRSRLDHRVADRQRIQRGARPAAECADGARLHPVPRHLRGPRAGAPPDRPRQRRLTRGDHGHVLDTNQHGDERRTLGTRAPRPLCGGPRAEGRPAPCSPLLGAFVLGWILLMLIVEGVSGFVAGAVHPDDAGPRHAGRRHRQCASSAA